MGAYRTVIGCNFEQYTNNTTNPNRYLILDIQDDKQVDNTTTIASHPLQDGDTMSDHMYRNPTKVNLSGSFSLNGKNWDDDSYNFISIGDRLTNIQEAFERILKEGILCTITTINEDDLSYTDLGKYTGQLKSNARSRYKVRKNMALESIKWTESQNNVKFHFTFHEVIMVLAQQEYEELSEEEKRDFGLPNVNYPQGSNLGSIMIETGLVPQIVVQNLYENGYTDLEFLKLASDTRSAALGKLTTEAIKNCIDTYEANIAAANVIQGIGTVVMAGSIISMVAIHALFPVGVLVALGGALIYGIGSIIKKTAEECEERYKRELAFRIINGSAEQDADRLKLLIDDIIGEINLLQTDLTIYNINGNYPQQVILNIANEAYIIEFKNDTTISKDYITWNASVSTLDGKNVETYNEWCPVSNIADLDRTKNLWFRDKTKNFEIYLVNPSLDPQINNQEGAENVAQRLDSYSIWVSDGDIQTQIKRIYTCIDNAITSRGYS